MFCTLLMNSNLQRILANKKEDDQKVGLEDAYRNMASALRVVEGGDRSVPSQAVTVYKESSEQITARMNEWTTFKQRTLPEINQKLGPAKLTPITIGEIDKK